MAYLDQFLQTRQEPTRSHWSNSATAMIKPKNFKPILSSQKREALIDRVIRVIAEFRLTPFENEGALRHSIRAGFCSQGNAWPRADFESFQILQDALRRVGASRPTWYEGQPECTHGRENCARCRRPLDDDDISHGALFCSPECRAVAELWRADLTSYLTFRASQRAGWHAAKAASQAKQCVQCGKNFKSLKDARYCSKLCAGVARASTLRDKTCQHCAIAFTHRNYSSSAGRFCSQTCYHTSLKSALTPLRCEECAVEFTPTHQRQKFCCQRCGQNASEKRRREAKAPRFPERPCDQCSTSFHPDRASGRFCCKACNTAFYNARKKAA